MFKLFWCGREPAIDLTMLIRKVDYLIEIFIKRTDYIMADIKEVHDKLANLVVVIEAVKIQELTDKVNASNATPEQLADISTSIDSITLSVASLYNKILEPVLPVDPNQPVG